MLRKNFDCFQNLLKLQSTVLFSEAPGMQRDPSFCYFVCIHKTHESVTCNYNNTYNLTCGIFMCFFVFAKQSVFFGGYIFAIDDCRSQKAVSTIGCHNAVFVSVCRYC